MKTDTHTLTMKYYPILSLISIVAWTSAALLHVLFLQETWLFRLLLSVSFFFWAFTRFILVQVMSTPIFHQRLVRIGGFFSLLFTIGVWAIDTWMTLDQLIGLWILIQLAIRLSGYIGLIKVQFRIMRMLVLDTIIALPYGLILVFNPYQSDLLQSWFVLLFMLGSSIVQTYRHLVIKKMMRDHQNIHTTRLHLPLLLSRVLPSFLIHTVNEWLLSDQRTVSNFASMANLTQRLHVYFVMNEKQQIRHSFVYIGFNEKIYHVVVMPRLNAKWPWQKQGVLLTSDEESFTHRFGFKYKHKITRFTLLISDEHALRINEQLNKLITFSQPYNISAIKKRKNFLTSKRMLSQGCELRAIQFEPFKSALSFQLSGVSFLRFVLKTSLWNTLPFKGVLTPNLVYEFCEEQYTIPHSYVVGRVNVEID
jgi:hypothetical protein